MANTAISLALAPVLVVLVGYALFRCVRVPLQKKMKPGRLKRLLLYKVN